MEMDNYTKNYILHHVCWVENGITLDKVKNSRFSDDFPFYTLSLDAIQKKLGYEFVDRDIQPTDFEKLTFLYLGLADEGMDLSFVKECVNLEEVDICYGCHDDFIFLNNCKKLKKIRTHSCHVKNLEGLDNFEQLEVLDLVNSDINSLKSISHYKNIKSIRVGIIEDEESVLKMIKNSEDLEVIYVLKGSETDFDKFNFPYYLILIIKKENRLYLSVTAKNESCIDGRDVRFPNEKIDNEEFIKKYRAKVRNDINLRLEKIIDSPFEIEFDEIWYTKEIYELEYEHKI